MSANPNRSLIIHFNDGSKKLFDFPAPVPAYAIKGVRFNVLD